MSCIRNPEVALGLLRAVVRQWSAFLETQIALEKALGVESISEAEIEDYIVELAPEFIEAPHKLTIGHVEALVEVFERQKSASECLSKSNAQEIL